MPPKGKAPVKKAPVKAKPAATKPGAGAKKTTGASAAAAAPPPAKKEPVVWMEIDLKQIDNLVMKDSTGKIKESGKWPVISDEAGTSATFLKYRDVNYIDTMNPSDMQPDRLRLAILGGIKYGKPIVIDMNECDQFPNCVKQFNEIEDGLLDKIMDKSLLKDEKYLSLVKDSDPPEYSQQLHSYEARIDDFYFAILAKEPSEVVLEKFFPVRIKVPA